MSKLVKLGISGLLSTSVLVLALYPVDAAAGG